MHNYSEYTKPGTLPPVTPFWGTGTCPLSLVTLTAALGPLQCLVLNYIFQVLFPETVHL